MPKSTITAADEAAIASARAFQVQILIGRGEYKQVGRPTLQTARE